MAEAPGGAAGRQKNICLVVLGPHRSGTSALAGFLAKLGGDLPKSLLPPTAANAKGYFESQKVMQFNDRLLADLGSRWDDIRSLDPRLLGKRLDNYFHEAVQILKDEFQDARLPILKDPRICRLVTFWRDACQKTGHAPVFIHTHRNPLETALSLEKRDALPIELGLLVWQRHVMDAEAATRSEKRVFTTYESLLSNPSIERSRIEAVAGPVFYHDEPLISQEVEQFLQLDLRHETRSPADLHLSDQVPEVVRKTFRIMDDLAKDATVPEDLDCLEKLRVNLNAVDDEANILAQALRRVTEREAELRSLCAAREDKIEELAAERAEIERDAELIQKGLQESLQERDDAIRDLERNTKTRVNEITLLSQILFETEKRLHEALSEAERQRYAAQELRDSTSWKLTAPMRAFVTWYRTCRSLLRQMF